MSATASSTPLLLPVLPEGVLEMILSRLPVESILCFKCVCKSWYALFNNPTFAAKHLQLIKANHGNQHVFLKRCLKDDEGKGKWVTCFFPDDYTFDKDERELVDDSFRYYQLSVIGHCDGIVALSLGSRFSDGVILCNPATRQSRTLPNSSFYPIPYGRNKFVDDCFQPAYEVGIEECDVYICNGFVGFGYDPKTKDYKVVRDVEFHWMKKKMLTRRVEVFSIGTGSSWREIDGGAIGEATSIRRNEGHFEQYFNGFFYSWGREERKNVLVSFDMADEVFRKMPMPHIRNHNGSSLLDIVNIFPRIGVYNNEFIALYVTNIPSGKGLMDVWVLKEFGVKESWTKQTTIDASATRMDCPLLFWKNNEEMLYEEDNDGEQHRNLFSYNLITHESKSLPLHSYFFSFSACRYIKTIVSVGTREELNQVGSTTRANSVQESPTTLPL